MRSSTDKFIDRRRQHRRARLLALGVGVLSCIGALWLFIQHTRYGSAILAVSQDPEAAQYMGIPSDRIFSIVMAISAALAATAGVLAGPFLTVQPTMWLLPIVKAFAIVIVGGLGSIPGSILAALMLGYAETIVGYLISTSWTEIVSVVAVVTDVDDPAVRVLRPARGVLRIAFREPVDLAGAAAFVAVLALLPLLFRATT